MNLFRPKTAFSFASFRDDFRETALIVGYVAPRVGRPVETVLGKLRSQITIEVSARIATALVEKLEANGIVLEPDAHFLYDPSERATWARKQIDNMSKMNPDADHPDPFVQLERIYGKFLTIGQIEVADAEGRRRKQPIRITTLSATPAEFHIVADRIAKRGQHANERSNRVANKTRGTSDLMQPGETFDEAKARHFDAIRRGKKI